MHLVFLRVFLRSCWSFVSLLQSIPLTLQSLKDHIHRVSVFILCWHEILLPGGKRFGVWNTVGTLNLGVAWECCCGKNDGAICEVFCYYNSYLINKDSIFHYSESTGNKEIHLPILSRLPPYNSFESPRYVLVPSSPLAALIPVLSGFFGGACGMLGQHPLGGDLYPVYIFMGLRYLCGKNDER